MGESEALRALRGELDALVEVHHEVGPVPLDTFFGEAAALVQTVSLQEVRTRLIAVGIDGAHLDKLPSVLSAAQDAQSAWVAVKDRSYASTLIELIDDAHLERSELLAAARFHLAAHPAIVEKLNAFTESEGLDELVQDLFSLAHLIEENVWGFERDTTFDARTRAEGAHELAEKLHQEAHSAEAFDAQQQELCNQRDRAYTLLTRLVEEIRGAGRYAFRNDPALLVRFRSDYAAARGRKRRGATRDDEASVLPPPPAAS